MKLVNLGFTDTAIPDVTSLSLPRGLVNFSADFKVKSEVPTEVILTNLTSPRERPENVRIAWKQKQNIYNNKGISPAVQSPSVTGVDLLVQRTLVASVTDDADATFRVDLPLGAKLILEIPSAEEITEDHVLILVGRLVSDLFNTGSEANIRLKALLRGSLLPSDL